MASVGGNDLPATMLEGQPNFRDLGGSRTVGGSLVATSASGHDAVELEIADTGESLFDEELHRAFNPSGANHRGTTGWSLAIVKQIAETLGGDATVANCPEGGVAFTLRIPQPIALEAAA